jgi:hypothetical protein
LLLFKITFSFILGEAADCIVKWLVVKIVTRGKYTKLCIQHCYLNFILFGSEDDQLHKQLAYKCLLVHYCFYVSESHFISGSLVHVLMARCLLFASFLPCVEYLSLQKDQHIMWIIFQCNCTLWHIVSYWASALLNTGECGCLQGALQQWYCKCVHWSKSVFCLFLRPFQC